MKRRPRFGVVVVTTLLTLIGWTAFVGHKHHHDYAKNWHDMPHQCDKSAEKSINH